MLKRLIVLGLSMATLSLVPAVAQQPSSSEGARAVPVRYADLDLSRAEDAAALLSRLRVAATRACDRSEVAQPGPAMRRAIESCRTQALDVAVARLDEPELTRLYGSQQR